MNRNTEFLSGIQRTMKLYEEMMKEICTKYHLTATEVDVIAFLKNNPGKDTAGDIVELRRLSKGGVSKAVESLIQKGLLERTPDLEDRRKIHLCLLKPSRRITEEIERKRKRLWKILFQGFSEEEIRNYMDFTGRIFFNIRSAAGGNTEA